MKALLFSSTHTKKRLLYHEVPKLSAYQPVLQSFASLFCYTRKRRMHLFKEWLEASTGEVLRMLDLGGRPEIWELIERPLQITSLNIPGENSERRSSSCHRFTYVEGDGCDVRAFDDQSFDLVFTNSVIEHVGDEKKQEAFAQEVRLWVAATGYKRRQSTFRSRHIPVCRFGGFIQLHGGMHSLNAGAKNSQHGQNTSKECGC